MFIAILKLVCGIIFAYTTIWLSLRWKLRVYYERFKNVKTIPGLPLPIGHSHLLLGKNERELFKFLDNKISEHGDVPIKLWFGPFFSLLVAKPHDANAIFTSPHGLQKHRAYKFLQNKTGLATAPVVQWRPSRKLLSPTFNFKMIQSFLPIFNNCSERMVQNLRTKLTGELFNCGEELFLCSLTMACFTTLGFDLKLKEYDADDFFDRLIVTTGLMTKRIFRVWLYPDFIYNFTKESKILNDNFKVMYKMTEDIVRRKKDEYNSMTKEERHAISDENDLRTPKIFINQILQMAEENNLSDLYIREQVDTMIFAGSETSALTVSYIALMLAMFPNIQDRVYQEIIQVTGGSKTVDYGMITKLNYTEMVIKETLRLYPVAPFLPRNTSGDIEISNCTIPKNCDVIISVFHLHRDKEVWGPDADKFNPDNFLPEKIKNRHPASFIPFSYGPRNCIAMRYGMMSMKVMLCHLLQSYQLSTSMKQSDLEFELHLTLRLVNNEYMIRLSERNSSS